MIQTRVKTEAEQEPGIDNIRLGELLQNALWAIRLARKAAPKMVTIRVVMMVLRSFIPVLFILCVKGLVDGFQHSGDVTSNLLWLVMLPVLLLVGTVLNSIAQFNNVRLRDELANSISLGFLSHASTLDLAFFEDSANQDLMNRAQQNSVQHCETLVNNMADLGRNVVQMILLAGIVIWISPLVATILAALAIPYGIVQSRMSLARYWREHRRAKRMRWSRYYSGKLSSHASIPEVKTFNLAPLFIDRYRQLIEGFRDENKILQLRVLIVDLVFGFIFTGALCGVGYWILMRALAGEISVGKVAALMLSAERLYSSVKAQARLVSGIIHSGMTISNLRLFQLSKPGFVSEGTIDADIDYGAIDFENISFTYPGCENRVLSDVSFHVDAGEVVAIVGQNGAGKSTLMKLLAHLYAPDSGRVKIDGYDVSELTERALHRNIAFVMQSFGRYDTTVHENIAYGNWERLLDDPLAVQQIAADAQIDQLVRSLPDGYETLLGRTFGQVTLSGGQWQSIAIARTLASDARIIVLDEPTSGLDPKREFQMFSRFRELVRGRTALIVSHRFSTVRMADRILVLDEGQLVEDGTHDQLVASGGMYSQMYNLHRQILDGSVVHDSQATGIRDHGRR